MLAGSFKKILQIGNFLGIILAIAVNSLAVILPIGGKTTPELSDALPNLFVPAGLTFSIWSIIYLLLIVFGVYQARDLFSKNQKDMRFLERIRFLFVVSCLANIMWIFLWQYQRVEASLPIMILLLISLLVIYLRLNIGQAAVSRTEKWCVHIPFSVYLGWITVATIANVTAVLVKIKWDGFGISQQIWTILVLIATALITIIMLLKRKDTAYALVIVWAFLGIVIKRLGNDPLYGVQTTIAYVAAALAIILFIGALETLIMPLVKKPKTG
jgi:hypothetical protein